MIQGALPPTGPEWDTSFVTRVVGKVALPAVLWSCDVRTGLFILVAVLSEFVLIIPYYVLIVITVAMTTGLMAV